MHKLDHVGWITGNIEKFERFWCKVMGFKEVARSTLTDKMGQVLFESNAAMIRKYSHPDWDVYVEIHCFDSYESDTYKFDRPGINHICLHTGGAGSRQEFIENLPDDVKVHTYDNPKGWQNIFIEDYEGNWVELREDI